MAIVAYCDKDRSHKGPLFTLQVIATEIEVPYRDRKVLRITPGHVCKDCLISIEKQLGAGRFQPRKHRD